jgi:hypothetical protein
MTWAITLIKGQSQKREEILDYLDGLTKQDDPFKNGVIVKVCYISFGWPDFVVLLNGNNVELLKDSIVKIRNEIYDSKMADNIETSTIVCTTKDEVKDAIKNAEKSIMEKYGEVEKSVGV